MVVRRALRIAVALLQCVGGDGMERSHLLSSCIHKSGRVPEWLKGPDCKSGATVLNIVGSNPTPTKLEPLLPGYCRSIMVHMSKPKKRAEARRLRRRGMSLKTISARVGCSLSSISLWCRDVELTPAQEADLAARHCAARTKGSQVHAQRRSESRADARREGALLVGELSDRDLLLVGVGLYLGDGSKTERCTIELTNMNAALHRLFLRWLRLFDVSTRSVTCRVNYTGTEPDVDVIEWWCAQLGLLPSQFKRVDRSRSSSSRRVTRHEPYKGTLHIRVYNTDLKSKILGMLDACTA